MAPSAGVTIAAGAASAVGIGLGAYLLVKALRGSQGGQNPCQGFECEGGTECPVGDSCAPCETGSSPDPNCPGCCIPSCPESCTEDSDCSQCGSGFVCENGECTKQIPSQILINGSPVVTAEPGLNYDYDEALCTLGVYCCCGLTTTSGGPTPTYTLQVVDPSGRGVPGVCVQFQNDEPWSTDYWNWTVVSSGGSCGEGIGITDDNGEIAFYLETTGGQPPGYTSQSDFPCTGDDSGTINVPAGELVISLPDYPSVPTATVTVDIQLYYTGDLNELCNCILDCG